MDCYSQAMELKYPPNLYLEVFMRKIKSLIVIIFGVCLVYPLKVHAVDNGFQPVTSLSTNLSPRGVAVGDVFGSGIQSFVVANFGSPTFIGQSTPATALNPLNSNIEIFNPSPTGLRLFGTIATAASPRGVFLFDAANKGRQDIFVTAYDANLLQIFDWQEGQFVKVGEASTLNLPVGITAGLTGPHGIDFAVVANYGSNSLSLFPLKEGKLGNRMDVPVDEGPTQVAIGDLNGDGLNEIAVVCLPGNKIDVLSQVTTSQDGSFPSFLVTKTISLPNGSAPSDLRVVDLNGDGRTDMVVSDFTKNSVYIYFQQTDGSLAAQPALLTSGAHPNGLTVSDLYGNGKKEIIVANRDSDSIDIFGLISGQFQLIQTLNVTQESKGSFGPVEVGALDTQGSGKKDLVVSHMRSNTIKILAQSINDSAFTAIPSPTSERAGTPFSEKTTFCYPNPTRDGNVKFSFCLEAPSAVTIQMFDVGGEMVWSQTLSPGQTQSGINLLSWSGTNQESRNLASGIYLFRVTVGNQTVTKKLAIIH
jgi:hypothetical protein